MENVVNFPAGAAKAWRAVEPVYREFVLEQGVTGDKVGIILEEMRAIHADLHEEGSLSLTLSSEIGLTQEQGGMISRELNAYLGEYTNTMSKRWYRAHHHILQLIIEKHC